MRAHGTSRSRAARRQGGWAASGPNSATACPGSGDAQLRSGRGLRPVRRVPVPRPGVPDGPVETAQLYLDLLARVYLAMDRPRPAYRDWPTLAEATLRRPHVLARGLRDARRPAVPAALRRGSVEAAREHGPVHRAAARPRVRSVVGSEPPDRPRAARLDPELLRRGGRLTRPVAPGRAVPGADGGRPDPPGDGQLVPVSLPVQPRPRGSDGRPPIEATVRPVPAVCHEGRPAVRLPMAGLLRPRDARHHPGRIRARAGWRERRRRPVRARAHRGVRADRRAGIPRGGMYRRDERSPTSGFRMGYQTNTTGFGAEAMLRLAVHTNDDSYIGLADVCVANLLDNLWLWDCGFGHGPDRRTFFGMFPLRDAPYLAAYEESEMVAKVHDFLDRGRELIRPSVRLLLAEYVKYALDRLWAYLPAHQPAAALATEPRVGTLQPRPGHTPGGSPGRLAAERAGGPGGVWRWPPVRRDDAAFPAAAGNGRPAVLRLSGLRPRHGRQGIDRPVHLPAGRRAVAARRPSASCRATFRASWPPSSAPRGRRGSASKEWSCRRAISHIASRVISPSRCHGGHGAAG